MHINLTFVIQIVNFLVVYKVLNSLLFKPVLASLEAKQEKKSKLEKSIKNKEEELTLLEKEKKENIVTFQQHAKQTYPFIQPQHYEKPIEVTYTKTTEADKKKLKKEVTDWLIKKVPHAY
jgi:hypothetical protein